MNQYRLANRHIHQADAAHSLKVIAIALLDQVHPDNGYACLTWAECAALMGGVSRKTVQNRLAALRAAHILHYSSNEYVYVTFNAWRNETPPPPASLELLPAIPDSRDSLPDSVPYAELPSLESGIAEGAGAALNPEFPPTPPRVSEYQPSTPEQELTHSDPSPLTPEQQRTGQMLRETGLVKAEELARAWPFAHCRDHLLQWTADRLNDPTLKPGALDYRITHRPAPPPSTDPRVRTLRRRWPTDEESAEQEHYASLINRPRPIDAAEVEPPLPIISPHPPPVAPIAAISVAAEKTWSAVQRELELSLDPATFNHWLRPIRLVAWKTTPRGPSIHIEAPDQRTRDFLAYRLESNIRRAFAHCGAPGVQIDFACPESAQSTPFTGGPA